MRSSFAHTAAAAAISMMQPLGAPMAQQQPLSMQAADTEMAQKIEENIEKKCPSTLKNPEANKPCIDILLYNAIALSMYMHSSITIDIGTYTRRFSDPKILESNQRKANNALDDLMTFCTRPLAMMVKNPGQPQFYLENAARNLIGCKDSFDRADKALNANLYPKSRLIVHGKAQAIIGNDLYGKHFRIPASRDQRFNY